MLQFFQECGRAEAMAAARRVQVVGVGKTRTEELRRPSALTSMKLCREASLGTRG